MRIVRNPIVFLAVSVMAASLLAGAAGACEGAGADGTAYEGKLFEGQVKSNKKNARVLVSLKPKKKEKMREITIRMGGEMAGFAAHPQIVVTGLKDSVDKIKANDWVRVCGPTSAMAAPRWAYAVEVFEKDDGAVDEE